LVVDDDAGVRSFFAKVLRRNGMEIREASSRWEALLILDRTGFCSVRSMAAAARIVARQSRPATAVIPNRTSPYLDENLFGVPPIAERSPHFLHGVHLLERDLQRLRRRVHRAYRCVTGRLGGDPSVLSCDPSRLPGFPEPFSFLAGHLEPLTMLIAGLARFLGPASDLLGLIPGSLPHILFPQRFGFGLSWFVRHVLPH